MSETHQPSYITILKRNLHHSADFLMHEFRRMGKNTTLGIVAFSLILAACDSNGTSPQIGPGVVSILPAQAATQEAFAGDINVTAVGSDPLADPYTPAAQFTPYPVTPQNTQIEENNPPEQTPTPMFPTPLPTTSPIEAAGATITPEQLEALKAMSLDILLTNDDRDTIELWEMVVSEAIDEGTLPPDWRIFFAENSSYINRMLRDRAHPKSFNVAILDNNFGPDSAFDVIRLLDRYNTDEVRPIVVTGYVSDGDKKIADKNNVPIVRSDGADLEQLFKYVAEAYYFDKK